LLRHRLEEADVEATVHSAGILDAGNPAHSHGVHVLSRRGIDLSRHRSRSMTAELLHGADLIIAMAREHVREAVVQAPDAWAKTFTLKELVRRGRRVGPRQPDESLEEWLVKLHAGRSARELMGVSTDDDVADPIGQPRQAYERMVEDLDALIGDLVWLVWGEAEDNQREEAS
jgi:protein-tyrosine phosphatase